jgi:hypothetical protein
MPVELKDIIEFKHEVQLAWLNLHVFSSQNDLFPVESACAMVVMACNVNHTKAVAGVVQINKND